MTGPIKAKVIVADDEEVIASTLAMILNQSGFHAIPVHSGEEAIKLAETFRPDLLISDVMMGGMTGIEAAIQIQNKLPTCKIVLISGTAVSAKLLEKANAHGYGFELLMKPVHPIDLLARLRNQKTSAAN